MGCRYILANYTRQGYRVLAIGYKDVDAELARDLAGKFDKHDVRRRCESGLFFAGLAILENRVKPETEPTLRQLSDANVRSVMVTGDNPLTGTEHRTPIPMRGMHL